MNVKKAKIVGFRSRQDSDYISYYCTCSLDGLGQGVQAMSFSSKDKFTLGSEVFIAYNTRVLKDGRTFGSWEIVNI